jgi:hypothetical protein
LRSAPRSAPQSGPSGQPAPPRARPPRRQERTLTHTALAKCTTLRRHLRPLKGIAQADRCGLRHSRRRCCRAASGACTTASLKFTGRRRRGRWNSGWSCRLNLRSGASRRALRLLSPLPQPRPLPLRRLPLVKRRCLPAHPRSGSSARSPSPHLLPPSVAGRMAVRCRSPSRSAVGAALGQSGRSGLSAPTTSAPSALA